MEAKQVTVYRTRDGRWYSYCQETYTYSPLFHKKKSLYKYLMLKGYIVKEICLDWKGA